MTEIFPRERRILKADEFASAFRIRPLSRSAHFVLHVRSSQDGNSRLGLVVARRFAPRAVTRNTIKRTAREIFRRTRMSPGDYIIRLRAPVNARTGPARNRSLTTELQQELRGLLSSHFLDADAARQN